MHDMPFPRAGAICFVLCCMGAGVGCDRKGDASGAQPAAPAQASNKGAGTAPAATRGGNGVYDLIERTYAPFTAADDPLGFPMKVRNLSTNSYRFWRGAKELFYEWAKT